MEKSGRKMCVWRKMLAYCMVRKVMLAFTRASALTELAGISTGS